MARDDVALREALQSRAFLAFRMGNEETITKAAFLDSLVCTINTHGEVALDRLNQLEFLAQGRPSLAAYCAYCRSRFPEAIKPRTKRQIAQWEAVRAALEKWIENQEGGTP